MELVLSYSCLIEKLHFPIYLQLENTIKLNNCNENKSIISNLILGIVGLFRLPTSKCPKNQTICLS